MGKYAIWNKEDPVLTPVGEIFSAEQWIQRHPIAGIDSITVICSAGEINGGFFATLGQMVDMYKSNGCDFSNCNTAEEKLSAIEAFDEAERAAEAEAAKIAAESKAANEELSATSLASIAAQLEYQNMMTLDDVEV